MLAGAYDKQFSDAAMEAYWLILGAMSCGEIRAAFRRAMAEEKFCPSPAAVRQHARALAEEAKPKAPEDFNWPSDDDVKQMKKDINERRRTGRFSKPEENGRPS